MNIRDEIRNEIKTRLEYAITSTSSLDENIKLATNSIESMCGLIIENYSNKINKMKKIIYTLSALLVIGAFILAYYVNTHREVRPQPDFSESKTIMNKDAIPPYVRDVCKETNDQAPGCLK